MEKRHLDQIGGFERSGAERCQETFDGRPSPQQNEESEDEKRHPGVNDLARRKVHILRGDATILFKHENLARFPYFQEKSR